jgi:hypothetical protein
MIKEKQHLGLNWLNKRGKYRGRVKKYTDKYPGMKHTIAFRKTTENFYTCSDHSSNRFRTPYNPCIIFPLIPSVKLVVMQ